MDRQVLVSEGDFPRLDSFIAENTELTRSHAQKLIEGGFVSVNGGEAKSKKAVKKGDVITVDLPEPEEVSLEPENIPLDIIYEDSSIAVINKQQGLTVHAGNGVKSGTLVNALLYHLDSLSGINGVIRPGIVHRID
ncbi:MAG: RluA family pseudouridine synthase, partial [Clostridia bacterium]|nr:RluA family pseudouridine synthase [Clostridia bacterium]